MRKLLTILFLLASASAFGQIKKDQVDTTSVGVTTRSNLFPLGDTRYLKSSIPVPVANGGTGTTTPAIVPGTGITVSGVWPNQTINASGSSGVNALTFTGTHENPSISGTTLNIPNMFGGVWQKMGSVLYPYFSADQYGVYEPTVIYDTTPQILTNATGSVFKMWYTYGTSSLNIGYAESYDGLKWERRTSAVVTGHGRSCVLKVGSTYYMYTVNSSGFTSMDRYTSTDGVTWTLATSGIITIGGVGTWNHGSIHNSSVYYDGTTWQMLLEANSAGGAVFTIGYYSSSDGITWTQYGSNPVIGSGSLDAGGPYLTKQGSTWYAWVHGGGTGVLPTNAYRYHSSNLTSWTIDNGGNPIITKTMTSEGVGSTVSQIADLTLCEANGKTYLFYAADQNGGSLTASQPGVINVAIANYTMANLVATNEGDGGSTLPNLFDKSISDFSYIPNATNVGNQTVWTPGSIFLGVPASTPGIQIRETTTTSTLSALYPTQLSFSKTGVSNFISAASNGLTFSANGATYYMQSNGYFYTNNLQLANLTTQSGFLYTSSSGVVNQTATGSKDQVLTSQGSGTPIFQGAAIIKASADLTAQTTAGNIIAPYTVGATDGSFMVAANLNITAISADVIQTQIVYTDETNTSRTLVMYGMGTTSAGLTTTGVSNYSPVAEIRCKAATTITVQTVLTTGGGSITFNAHATIMAIR